MNNLLSVVAPLINSKTAKITLDISAASTEGELMVIVKPMTGPVSEKAPEELRTLCAALAQPIKVVGEPDAIEQALAQVVQEQAGKRSQWANRAAELDAAIAAGASKDAKKTPGKTARATETSGPIETEHSKASAESEDSESAPNFGSLV